MTQKIPDTQGLLMLLKNHNEQLVTTIRNASIILVAGSMWPTTATWLESSMVLHMLVQLPLLGIAGACLLLWHPTLVRWLQKVDHYGVMSLVLGSGFLIFWMLPLHLDLATIDPLFRLLKVITVPVGIGIALTWAIMQSCVLLRMIIGFECWASVARLGWVFVESPEQLCSSYLIGEQQQVGTILLWTSAVTGLSAISWALFGTFDESAATKCSETKCSETKCSETKRSETKRSATKCSAILSD